MMEVTSDGIVRWGFGFYNPNHAAALITLLFPCCGRFSTGRGAGRRSWRASPRRD